MAQNVGTLISASIRPNDSLDPIASAFSSEIKGGLHTATASSNRDSIIFERREWGMLSYVINDDKTYQLTYGYADTNIMNNANWKEFTTSGGGGSEWVDSVIAIQNAGPVSPSNGDRYIVGPSPTGPVGWTSLTSGIVVEWKTALGNWQLTTPTDGMSVRVDNMDNAIYKYEGTFPTGSWELEKLNLVRYLNLTTINGASYSAVSDPPLASYSQDLIFLSKFPTTNTGATLSVNVNGLGDVQVKKTRSTGLVNLYPNEILTSIVYSLYYDGTYFQMTSPSTENGFNIKHYIEPSDYIIVPQYYQYWVYGNLEVAGQMINYGQIIIANGGLILSGGTISNMAGAQMVMLSLSSGSTSSYNDSDTIQFSYQTTISGPSVSAIVKDGSLTSSKIDTGLNGGATAGYLLSVDAAGDFSWILPTSTSTTEFAFDDKNYLIPVSSTYDGFFTGLTISNTPLGHVMVFVNGLEIDMAYGSTTSNSCYFSGDGGVTSKSQGNILVGDGLYWNGGVAGYELTTVLPDRVSLSYLK